MSVYSADREVGQERGWPAEVEERHGDAAPSLGRSHELAPLAERAAGRSDSPPKSGARAVDMVSDRDPCFKTEMATVTQLSSTKALLFSSYNTGRTTEYSSQ